MEFPELNMTYQKTAEIEILNGAIKVLEDNKWTRNYFARDSESFTCDVNSQDAVSFCTVGAVQRSTVLGGYSYDLVYNTVDVLLDFLNKGRKTSFYNVSSWNDHTAKNKREVISTIRKCVKELENE